MDFWTVSLLASVTVCTGFVVVSILYGRARKDWQQQETSLYKSRIAEIDLDEQLGRLASEEADEIKLLESRRLLENSKAREASGKSFGLKSQRIVLVVSALFVFVFAVLFYLQTASFSPPLPLSAASDAPGKQSFMKLLRSAEARLAQNPDDSRGWKVLAPVYMSLGQTEKGIAAFRKALSLSGPDPELMTALGEALVVKNSGIVDNEALQLFNEAIQLDPDNDLARYYGGLFEAQNGRSERAIVTWNSILERNADDQEWSRFLRERIAGLENVKTLAPTPELDEETIEAMNELEQSEQAEMINQMVASLAQRLEENPDDQIGWERLIRSYIVLGRKSDTLEAIKKAKEQFPESTEFLSKLDEIESGLN